MDRLPGGGFFWEEDQKQGKLKIAPTSTPLRGLTSDIKRSRERLSKHKAELAANISWAFYAPCCEAYYKANIPPLASTCPISFTTVACACDHRMHTAYMSIYSALELNRPTLRYPSSSIAGLHRPNGQLVPVVVELPKTARANPFSRPRIHSSWREKPMPYLPRGWLRAR